MYKSQTNPYLMTKEEFNRRYVFNVKSDKLGDGSFGTVYRVWDSVRSEYKALKIAQVKLLGNKEYGLQQEYEIIKDLGLHANIANYDHVHTFETEAGLFSYAIMQYYPCGNLKELLLNQKLNITQKQEIALGLLSGIQFLHDHKILHRDLKPSNILVAEYAQHYTPKITDFGISKIMEAHEATNSGIGWTAYASPEMLKGIPLTLQADLWSLGVILYELFHSRHPFHAATMDSALSVSARVSLNKSIIQDNMPDDISLLPQPYNDIVAACLHKTPAERPQTLKPYIDELANIRPSTQAAIAPPQNAVEDTLHYQEEIAAKQPKRASLLLTIRQGLAQSKRSVLSAIAALSISLRGRIIGLAQYLQKGIRGLQRLVIQGTRQGNAHRKKIALIVLLLIMSFLGAHYSHHVVNAWNKGWLALQHYQQRNATDLQQELTTTGQQGTDSMLTSITSPQTSTQKPQPAIQPNDQQDVGKDNNKASKPTSIATTEPIQKAVPSDGNNENRTIPQEPPTPITIPAEPMDNQNDEDTKDITTIENAATEQQESSTPRSEPSISQPLTTLSNNSITTEKIAPKKSLPTYFAAIHQEMVKIPGGSFTFGCDTFDGKDCDDDEKPPQKMTINGYEISKHEVSQKMFEAVMGYNPSSYTGCPDCPVETVSWYEAQQFIQRLNDADDGYHYKLPTEQEWEYAATANSQYKYAGSNDVDKVAINKYTRFQGPRKPQTVGSRHANRFALYDMSGNVAEWCANWYDKAQKQKAVRGGSYKDGDKYSRINNRRAMSPNDKYPFVGFRIMRKKQ